MYMQGDRPFRSVNRTDFEGMFGSRRYLSDHHHEEERHHDEEYKERKHKRDASSRITDPFPSKETYHRRSNDYLVNLRSPLDRIASWFVYEHTENHGSSKFNLISSLVCCFLFIVLTGLNSLFFSLPE